jgi:hypothetical protein
MPTASSIVETELHTGLREDSFVKFRWARLAILVLCGMWGTAICFGQARVVGLQGALAAGGPQSRPLRIGDPVQSGEELLTGENAEAVIQTSDGSTVRIFPDSRIIFHDRPGDLRQLLHLFLGSIKVHIERISGRPNPHQLTTPTAVIAVRGTTFSIFVDESDATLVAVDEGLVGVANVASPAQEVLLRRGQRTWVGRGLPPIMAQAFRGRSERADRIPGVARGLAGESRAAAARPANFPPGRAVGRPEGVPPARPPLDAPGILRRPGPRL